MSPHASPPSPLPTTVAISVGAIAGALLRHRVTSPPYAPLRRVFAVNICGSLLLGATHGLSAARLLRPPLPAALATGFCGSLTTFSTFSAGALSALRERRPRVAAGYIVASCVLGVLAVAAGDAFARAVAGAVRK